MVTRSGWRTKTWLVLFAGMAATCSVQAAALVMPPEAPLEPPPPEARLGTWRWELGLGASVSTGNTEASSATFNADGTRLSAEGRWHVSGRLLYAKGDQGTTAEQLAADSRYDHTLTPQTFVFSQVGGLRDRPANLDLRLTAGAGVGYYLLQTLDTTWDVTTGLGYAQDRYTQAIVVDGGLRTALGRAELLLGESSTHRLSATTSFKQQLALSPALDDSGLRAEWKAGLAVDITEKLKLTVNGSVRYNSDPGVGLQKLDTLLVTGVQLTVD